MAKGKRKREREQKMKPKKTQKIKEIICPLCKSTFEQKLIKFDSYDFPKDTCVFYCITCGSYIEIHPKKITLEKQMAIIINTLIKADNIQKGFVMKLLNVMEIMNLFMGFDYFIDTGARILQALYDTPAGTEFNRIVVEFIFDVEAWKKDRIRWIKQRSIKLGITPPEPLTAQSKFPLDKSYMKKAIAKQEKARTEDVNRMYG